MPRLSEIVMTAPDADTDVFMAQAKDIRSFARGMTLCASANDRALVASRGLAGKPRARDVFGDGPIVMDEVETGRHRRLSHGRPYLIDANIGANANPGGAGVW